jgi:hypothetical protein
MWLCPRCLQHAYAIALWTWSGRNFVGNRFEVQVTGAGTE